MAAIEIQGLSKRFGSVYPVVTIALARVYLGERLERAQQVGIAVCLAGVVAIVL